MQMFSTENRSGPPPATNPFWTGPLLNSKKPSSGVRDRHNTQMVVNKTTNGAVVS